MSPHTAVLSEGGGGGEEEEEAAEEEAERKRRETRWTDNVGDGERRVQDNREQSREGDKGGKQDGGCSRVLLGLLSRN